MDSIFGNARSSSISQFIFPVQVPPRTDRRLVEVSAYHRHRGTSQTVSMPWVAGADPQYLHRQEYSHADPNPAGDRLKSDD